METIVSGQEQLIESAISRDQKGRRDEGGYTERDGATTANDPSFAKKLARPDIESTAPSEAEGNIEGDGANEYNGERTYEETFGIDRDELTVRRSQLHEGRKAKKNVDKQPESHRQRT